MVEYSRLHDVPVRPKWVGKKTGRNRYGREKPRGTILLKAFKKYKIVDETLVMPEKKFRVPCEGIEGI